MSGIDNRRHVAPGAIYRGFGVGARGVFRGKVWDGAADIRHDLCCTAANGELDGSFYLGTVG